MFRILLTIGIVTILLLAGEYLRRVRKLPSEITRKFVHITVGSFVAFWPFFLSWHSIEIFSALFVVGVLTSQYFNLFRAIHSVQRPTWGELFFALSVGGVALLTHNAWIYMAAILQMSLADGLAAIIGTRWGRGHFYKILGHQKSPIGTAAFFTTSLLVLLLYAFATNHIMLLAPLLGLAITGTVIENIAGLGLDNALIPLLVALVLRLLG